MTKSSKAVQTDFQYYIDGEDIKTLTVAELISWWKDFSHTKVLRSNIFVAGTSLLEELASRLAELGINFQAEIKNQKKKAVPLLEKELKDQNKIIVLLRDHCRKSSLRQVIQDAKIKSLEKDKECLHGLIDYQKAELNEQAKN